MDSLPNSALLTIPQAATYSQEQIAIWYRRVQRGQVRVVKVGRSVRIRKRDMLAFFDYQ